MSAGGRQPLAGRVAVVTGGTAGIGAAACRALAAGGAAVMIVGRRPQRVEAMLADLRAALPAAALAGLAADVRDAAAMRHMAATTLQRFGRIDLLVASAGILRADGGAIHTLRDTSVDEWHQIVDVNLNGVFLSNRAVLPAMLEQGGGMIVNVSSTSGRRAYAYDAAYCATKFGVIGLSEALAEEVRPRGIRVHALLPGAIETDMWDQNGPIPRPQDVLPVSRVADLIAWLAALPEDVEMAETIIEPLRIHERPAWFRDARRASPREVAGV